MVTRIVKAKAIAEHRRRNRLSSFDSFLKYTSPHLTWDLNYLVHMRGYLDRIIAGETLKVMFLIPPQHGKTTQNTIHFAPYYLLKKPRNNIILASYGASQAANFSRRAREIYLQHRAIPKRFSAASNEWETGRGGVLVATGKSSVTGNPANLVIIDDPVNGFEEAYSKTKREKAWHWWCGDLTSRLKDSTSVIFTMTRWHHDDLAGRILKYEPGRWIVVKIPALAKDNDILGRKVGDALWEKEHSKKGLLIKKKEKPLYFQSLYQQEPSLDEGNIFKSDYWKFYDKQPEKFKKIIQSWDTAFKAKEENDYSVCMTIGETNEGYYILDLFRGKPTFPVLKQTAINLYERYKPSGILIEDAASGQCMIQDLKSTILPIIPIKTNNTADRKVVNAHTIIDILAAGKVFLPSRREWVADVLEETMSFPNGVHDDIVDTLTMGLNHMNQIVEPQITIF